MRVSVSRVIRVVRVIRVISVSRVISVIRVSRVCVVPLNGRPPPGAARPVGNEGQ